MLSGLEGLRVVLVIASLFIVKLNLYRTTNQQQLVTPTNYILLLNLVDSLVSTFCFDSNMNETKLCEEKQIVIQLKLFNTCIIYFFNLIRVKTHRFHFILLLTDRPQRNKQRILYKINSTDGLLRVEINNDDNIT